MIKHKTGENPSYKHCLNCGAELNGMYCHQCGQHATSKTPTIGGFVMEYMNTAFIWDSKCIMTLWTLIRRPDFCIIITSKGITSL